MKVGIGSIREIRGGAVSFEGSLAIDFGQLGIDVVGPVNVRGTVTNTGEGFLVQASVDLEYRADCARCLEPITRQETVLISEEFTSDRESADTGTLFYFSGDFIVLDECIREQVMLSIPMKILCSDDCRGICPECGRNLNQGPCSCFPPNSNPQLSKLKTLLSTEGGGTNGKS